MRSGQCRTGTLGGYLRKNLQGRWRLRRSASSDKDSCPTITPSTRERQGECFKHRNYSHACMLKWTEVETVHLFGLPPTSICLLTTQKHAFSSWNPDSVGIQDQDQYAHLLY